MIETYKSNFIIDEKNEKDYETWLGMRASENYSKFLNTNWT